MGDAKNPGVERLPLEILEGAFRRAVYRIAKQGMADGSHVDAFYAGRHKDKRVG